MTEKDKATLRRLQAQAKKEAREEKQFWERVDREMSDILARGLSDILERYECNLSELLEHIGSDKQVDYYKRTHAPQSEHDNCENGESDHV